MPTLGRGLSSLIPKKGRPVGQKQLDPTRESEADILIQRYDKAQIKHVSPQQIKTNPHQPRTHFAEAAIEDLVESIKVHGILQPLVVTELGHEEYELVAGERRLRASKQARLKHVPVIVRTAGELEKLELSLIENIQRQDLNPIERAKAYRKLIDDFSLTHEKAAKRLGKSRPVVSNALRLLELPSDVQNMIGKGQVSESHALALLELKTGKQQLDLAHRISAEKLTKQETRKLVQTRRKSKDKVYQTEDLSLKALEQALQESLKTRVRIRARGKTGWQIEIEAHSREELMNLFKQLNSL